ncbi:hypothetical protein [Nocardia sp. NPDC019255]|uniref:hypothetical protein n=1 Tax=Nocardia sp. NPDC019255 TaxID=3154591 RepID=UPI0033DF16C2
MDDRGAGARGARAGYRRLHPLPGHRSGSADPILLIRRTDLRRCGPHACRVLTATHARAEADTTAGSQARQRRTEHLRRTIAGHQHSGLDPGTGLGGHSPELMPLDGFDEPVVERVLGQLDPVERSIATTWCGGAGISWGEAAVECGQPAEKGVSVSRKLRRLGRQFQERQQQRAC